MGVSELLASYVADMKYDDIPPGIIENAKEKIIDTIGSAIGGSKTKHAQQIVNLVHEIGGNKEATIICSSQKSNILNAALANGVLAHAIDFDDTHKFLHPGCSIISTALAVGEKYNISGKEFLTAVIAGYDVAIRISLAVGLSHRYRGFHPTGTCNSFGAAVTAGKIMKFNKQKLINAIGLAATMASGIAQYRYGGSKIKHFHGGRSAQNGVMAALMTEEGYVGPLKGLEGTFGFFNAYADEHDVSHIKNMLGNIYEIENTDLKPYPSCRQTHNPVDLAVKLVKDNNISHELIEKIVLVTYDYIHNCAWLMDNSPGKTPLEAMLNISYCVALAVKDKELTLSSFTEEAVNSTIIQNLVRKVEYEKDQNYSELYPQERNILVRITTASGDVFEAHSSNAKGSKKYPMSTDEILDKFSLLTKTIIDDQKQSQIVKTISSIDEIDNIGKFAEILGA